MELGSALGVVVGAFVCGGAVGSLVGVTSGDGDTTTGSSCCVALCVADAIKLNCGSINAALNNKLTTTLVFFFMLQSSLFSKMHIYLIKLKTNYYLKEL